MALGGEKSPVVRDRALRRALHIDGREGAAARPRNGEPRRTLVDARDRDRRAALRACPGSDSSD